MKQCPYCNQELVRRTNEELYNFKKRQFCRVSCSSRYKLNQLRTNGKAGRGREAKPRYCIVCNKQITTGAIRRRKYCDDCRPKIKNINNIRSSESRKGKLFYDADYSNHPFMQKTLGEARRNHGMPMNRYNYIRELARKIYRYVFPNQGCERCGYKILVEVCHIKSIPSHSDDTLIKDINHINNLVGLCPNCHCELDRNLFTVNDIDRFKST